MGGELMLKYASTAEKNGVETIVVVLPLAAVPGFDPNNPMQPGTYGVPDNVQVGWVRDGNGGWVEPVIPAPTLAEAIASKLGDLAAYRFDKETGGITVSGINVLTDRESQATLTGAYVAVQLNPDRLIDWKASDGTWTQIDRATVEFLAGAVADHVQSCFSTEKAKAAEILALTTVDAVLAYDVTVGW